jgi:hypothetical protein
MISALTARVKSKAKININVKSVGQECPTQTSTYLAMAGSCTALPVLKAS